MRERLLPWLLILPALFLATPLSPLDGDPYPHLAGTGLDLVLLAPLALVTLASGWHARRALPFVAALAWACLSFTLGSGTDPFEARRALGVLALLPLALVAGSALDARGRATFARILAALSLLWTGLALARGFLGDSFAGTLGDTGSLSQAALPGAAVAASWVARADGKKRLAGAVVLAAFLTHTSAAPVLAGAHTLLAGLLFAAWRGEERGRGLTLGLALTALLSPFVGLAARQALRAEAPAIQGAQSTPSHSLGGLAVRAHVWTAALSLVGEHPLLGAGPGQFQAAFPPHRDPLEIERSRHGTCAELDTEVEHAHNDWLQGFCELGLVGGALLALGLALAARDTLRALGDPERAPLALAASALLANALVHAPLSNNPATGPLALALFGAVGSSATRSRPWAALTSLPALLALAWAPAAITHGAALREYAASAGRIGELAESTEAGDRRSQTATELVGELARARAILRIALAAVPDSAPARSLTARLVDDEEGAAAWDRVLELRPHSAEAWEQSGVLEARAGRPAEARARLERALALTPTHPRLLRSLVRLELISGELERGLGWLAQLREQGCLQPELTLQLGVELVLELGRPGRGARVLFDQALSVLVPEDLHARAGAEDDPARAEATECLAQLLWGRAHAASGAFDAAVRSYRQATQRSAAWRSARGAGSTGPAAPLALELAAALERAGRRDEALRALEGLQADPGTWAELPGWAREALADLGLGPGEER